MQNTIFKASTAATLFVILSGCTHTLNFRASHFATPITADEPWAGHIALAGTAVTKVTVVNDVTSNPPRRDTVRINQDIDVGDVTYINNLSIDGRLTVWQGLEAYIDGSLWGLRYQFLNHGSGANKWVAAGLLATGSRNSSSSSSYSSNSAEASSDIRTNQVGLSVGYKTEDVVPYVSFIRENHKADTKVTGTNGNFGPYSDQGTHQYYSIGVTSYKKGLAFGAEYSRIQIKWDNSESTGQDALGLKIGYAW